MSLAEKGISAPAGFSGAGFVVRPIVPGDVELDYEAVMSSREFLRVWEQDPPWPADDFTVEQNLADLERLDRDHRQGTRYCFTVISADDKQVLGCLYFVASDAPIFAAARVASHDGTGFADIDLVLFFWVRTSTWESGFETTLLDAVWRWMNDSWDVEAPAVCTNEALHHQIATIESLGLVRRFEFSRDREEHRSLVYC